MFKLADGRDCLYQWDSNLKLIVEDESISEVHFMARYSKEIYTVEVIRTESEAYVNIPNILLQQTYSIIAYAVSNSGSGNYTKTESAFEVVARPKPSDYVYTETELKTFETFREQFEDFKERFDAIVDFEEVAF